MEVDKKKKEDGFISAEAVPLRLVPNLRALGTQLKSKRKHKEESAGRAQQIARKDCSDDNYGNGSIFMFENIFILKVLAYLNFFFNFQPQMYQEN